MYIYIGTDFIELGIECLSSVRTRIELDLISKLDNLFISFSNKFDFVHKLLN
jgi:hypothetical protein